MGVRYARPWVRIGGVTLPVLDMHWSRKAERSADRFTATLSVTKAAQYGFSLAEFADWQPQDVELIASLMADGSDEQSVILGRVDEPEICWKEMTVTLQGRDKSASLTDKRRSEKFQNQKTEEIVSKIAKEHGLTAHVQADAPYAGKIYTQDFAHLALNRTDYDILSDLADRQGCRWYVEGNDLYFEPRDAGSNTVDVYWIPPSDAGYAQSNALDLKTRRNMTAARPHRMRHRSWHHYDAQQYEAMAEMDGMGDPVEFDHHHNGRKQDQVEALAQGRLKNATRHDLSVSVEMPLDLTVSPRKRLTLRGTGTVYDQGYDIDGVEGEMAWASPAIMRLECKSAKDGRKSGQGAADASTGAGTTTTASQPAAQASYPTGGA